MRYNCQIYSGVIKYVLEQYQHALQVATQLPDLRSQIAALSNISVVLLTQGQLDKALVNYRQANCIAQKLKDPKEVRYIQSHLKLLRWYENRQ